MLRNILIIIAVINVLTGLQIFLLPEFFYETVPGVKMMGPYNVHFIRDAGLAYGACGLLMALGWRREDYLLCLGGGTWTAFHALFHFQMWLARGLPVDLVAVVNLLGIQLPAWATIFAAFTLYRAVQSQRSQSGHGV